MTEEKKPVYFTYKDRVFRLLYRDKHRLLELYNALNDTSYTNVDDLTVTTLENAIFIKMKNDVSFIIDCDMCLYEHQSTYCPNMPLRGLLYFADLYKKYIRNVDLSVSRQIKIPTPHYVVFYNGTERKEQEFIQKLSDAFEDESEGCIELVVRTININYGYNKELMSRCKSLADYAYFVAEIRKNLEQLALQDAVEYAVDICIEKDILKEFLLEQKSEVIAMSIYEYNEEYVRKALFEDGVEKGYNQGIADGESKLGRLISLLMEEGKSDLVMRIIQDEKVREEYYKKYNM
ncbi:MAG: hypothetical protein J6A94_01995 [Lachnospiraceae bacterium]|nr:hypothetical protein [Lachnospiraceae bacterium]